MRRLCVLSASVTVCIALVAGLPASAAAQVSDPISPSNWTTDPSGGHSITSVFLNSVFALPTPFATTWNGVFRGTRVLPELDLIPGLWTIALGLSAFEAGYLIGSAIDRKWIHVDGTDLGTTFAVGAYTTPVRLGICTSTTSPCFGFLPSGPLWAYQWGASWGTLYYDSTDAAKHAAYVVLHSLTSGTELCVAQTTGPGGVSE